ncbi:MAG: carboxypeptidase regulatory-like domain-containing protein [Pirellulales bacterium]|nr:carboxypeptidase regulatory-like domain-containing protein [Pirellulales bacterium]
MRPELVAMNDLEKAALAPPAGISLLRSLVAATMLALVGCGGAYDAVVTGEVRLDGQPITTGAVAFIPAAGGPTAYAQIDANGRYDIHTGKERGLPSGSYGVTVVSREPPATERSKTGGPPPPGKALTPEWYALAQYSPLKVDVKPGKNDVPLELTNQAPAGWTPTRRPR